MKLVQFLSAMLLVTILFGSLGGFGEGVPQRATIEVCSSGCRFSKIQDAIATAKAGDVIQIAAGVYKENIVISKDLTLRGPNSEGAVISAEDANQPAVLIKGAHSVALSHLAISGAKVGVRVEGGHVTILDNTIIVDDIGIDMWSFVQSDSLVQGNALIGRNQVHRTGFSLKGVGLMLIGSSSYVIHDNFFQKLGTGMVIGGGVVCDIRNNRLSKDGDGIIIGSVAQARIIENHITDNYRNGIVVSGASRVEISGNTIKGNDSLGVALKESPCYVTNEKFVGSVTGTGNEISDNAGGNLCPATYHWPKMFLKGD